MISARLWQAFQEAQLDCWESGGHAMGECCEREGLAAALMLAADATRHRLPSELLTEFHTRPGVDCVQPTRSTVDVDGSGARVDYIVEEAQELSDAIDAGDVVAAADALGDLVYTVYGAAWRFGIDLDAVVEEVHRSNMTKTPTPGDGKAIKGRGYSRPNIAAVLARH